MRQVERCCFRNSPRKELLFLMIPNSDHRYGSGVRCGIWQWQELEEIITPSAGLVWSPGGLTATRMGSAQPTRLPAE
jgi:hypothetical protein